MAFALPEPDFTIIVKKNTTEPLLDVDVTQEIRSWLSKHNEEEDILDGNPEDITDYDELKLLGPHPLLERQMHSIAPLRWLHLKLQVAGSGDHWVHLILRADNVYMKGFINQPNGGLPSCFEITEEPVYGKVSDNHIELFPPEYNSVPLHWGVKYQEMMECEKGMVEPLMRQMLGDPNFMANGIEHLSFHNPITGSPTETKRILAGITFKVCEFLRMRLTLDCPNMMGKVWKWRDICKDLRKWKKSGYDRKSCGWRQILQMEPRDALESTALVLNQSDGAFKFAEGKKARDEKKLKKGNREDSGSKQGKTPKKHHSAGASKSYDGCDSGKNFSVPVGSCRIQILGIQANFEIDDIFVHDSHRYQQIYVNRSDQEAGKSGMKGLILCGPRRPIGAYGCFGLQIFPAESDGPEAKRRRTSTGGRKEFLSQAWDADLDDTEPSRHVKELCASSNRRLQITYLHIPNTIEAEVSVQMYFVETAELSGFMKATTSAYGGNYLELFRKENEELVCVSSGQWTAIPLLVKVLSLPYHTDLQLDIHLDMSIAQSGGRHHTLREPLTFSSKCGNQKMEFDGYKIDVTVMMQPDPHLLS